ncbi:MAG: hypothetical protein GY798_01705 [Hyphomicrobiales bacterium]|nr:hypothetical protein [Hyphomicrobiales bacterium]
MAAQLTVDLIERLFRDGVESVERISSGLSNRAWERPACGRWTGAQTARHLAAVARWYHEWLDRAIAGDASPPFTASEMDQRNDDALARIGDISGPEAITDFAETATDYLRRATAHWNLAYGYPYGTVTVGLHCGVAAAEWHLHAWDLSHTSELRHRPQNPEALFTAAGMCLAEAKGGLGGAMLRFLVPLGARRSPWPTILQRSGRTPTENTIGSG